MIWLALVVTLCYAVSALARILPVRRKAYAQGWRDVAYGSAATILALGTAGCAYTVLAAAHVSPVASVQHGVRLGVFTPSEGRSWRTVAAFSKKTGQPVSWVLDYVGQGEPFPAQLGREAARHHAEPVLQLEPSMPLSQVVRGRDDSYLRSLAAQVRAYHRPVTLSWAPEANGSWYYWGWTHTPASVYRASWSHVMAVFRADRNVTWMDTVNVRYPGAAPTRDYLVPGIDEVGIDGYYTHRGDTFSRVFDGTLHQVRAATRKPVLISETAIGPVAGQVRGIASLVSGARANHLDGLIWFDKSRAGHGSQPGALQDWRLTPAGAAALRSALSGPGSR